MQRELFQSTRPIRGATTYRRYEDYAAYISIHAPHTGRDQTKIGQADRQEISIHAPHTGRDERWRIGSCGSLTFQSTRPIRGATPDRTSIGWEVHEFQSTRPIRGATPHTTWPRTWAYHFNPRAPYGARPASYQAQKAALNNFNPRAPYGARHQQGWQRHLRRGISIHAPHTGRDSSLSLRSGLI